MDSKKADGAAGLQSMKHFDMSVPKVPQKVAKKDKTNNNNKINNNNNKITSYFDNGLDPEQTCYKEIIRKTEAHPISPILPHTKMLAGNPFQCDY